MIGWCVVERGYEYNDEISYGTEFGTPASCFAFFDEAKAFCQQKNLEWIKNVNIDNYCYDISDILQLPAIEYWDLDHERWIEGTDFEFILNHLRESPYYIVQVELH